MKLFLSYAHGDNLLAEVFIREFAAIVKIYGWELWYDEKIPLGKPWHDYIQSHIAQSDGAVLLLSTNFLTSKYISEHEWEKIKSLQQEKGVHVFPLLLRAIPDPSVVPDIYTRQIYQSDTPFSKVYDSLHERDNYLVNFAKAIKESIEGTHDIVQNISESVQSSISRLDLSTLKNNLHIPIQTHFTGRRKEITDVFNALDQQRYGCVAITGLVGMGGIGKSTLATEILKIIRWSWNTRIPFSTDRDYNGFINDLIGKRTYFPEGILWVKLEHDQTLEKVFEEQIFPQMGIKEDLSSSVWKESFKAKIADRNFLVVLDSAEQNEDVFFKLDFIFDHNPRIMTTRKPLGHQYPLINLNTFSVEDALSLFRSYYPECLLQNEDITAFCTDYLGNLPLTVVIVAVHMVQHRIDSFETLKRDILKLDMQDNDRGQMIYINTEKIFEMSFAALKDQQAEIFKAASVFYIRFSAEMLHAILPTEFNLSLNGVEAILDHLFTYSLLQKGQEGVDGYYAFHPLMRKFALIKLHETDPEGRLYQAKRQYVLNQVQNDPNVIETNELFATVQECKTEEVSLYMDFASALNYWLHNQGYWSIREEMLRTAASEAEKKREIKRKFSFLKQLVHCLNSMNKHEKAREIAYQCEEYFSKNHPDEDQHWLYYLMGSNLYESNKSSQSFAWNMSYLRDTLYRHQNYYRPFIRTNSWINSAYGRVQRAYQMLCTSFQDSYDLSLEDLLNLQFKKGSFDVVNRSSEKIDRTVLINDIDYSIIMAMIHYESGQITEARASLSKAIQKHQTIRHYDSGLLCLQIRMALYDKNFVEAKELIEQIRDKMDKQHFLGNYYLAQGKAEDALEHLQKALDIALEANNPYDESQIRLSIAETLLRQKKRKESVRNLMICRQYRQALQLPFLPEEERRIAEVVDGIDKELYREFEAQLEKEIPIPQHHIMFMEDLPEKHSGKDGKTMLLIPEGLSFFGEGEPFVPTVEEIITTDEATLRDQLKNLIYLYPFYMDEYPVTNAEYITYCHESETAIPKHLNEITSDAKNQPVTGISVNEAMAYAKFYDKTLPLPEEWEKACRGSEGYLYPWGDQWEEGGLDDITSEYDINEWTNEIFGAIDTSFEEFLLWLELHENEEFDTSRLGEFDPLINVDPYQFFRSILASISLDVHEKIRVMDAVPTLSQFQVDQLLEVFEEEKEKFKNLQKEHPNDVQQLFEKMCKDIRDVLSLRVEQKNISNVIFTVSPYKIQNMVGIHYEVCMYKDNAVLKGGSVQQYNRAENLKATHSIIEKRLNYASMLTGFRCVKPIFSPNDLRN